MAKWWEQLDQGSTEDLQAERIAYFNAFYSTAQAKQCLAQLRLIIAKWPGQGATISEKSVACLALDDLLMIIRIKAGVTDELAIIEAEARISETAPLPEMAQPEPIEGFTEED